MPDDADDRTGGRERQQRADVIAALRRHGISGAVAAELWRSARTLRSNTRRRGIEHAVTLEAVTGQPVGGMRTGTETNTDLTRHIQAFESGRAYVSLHTHPKSTSFSNSDVRLLAEQSAIAAMVAVGVDGT